MLSELSVNKKVVQIVQRSLYCSAGNLYQKLWSFFQNMFCPCNNVLFFISDIFQLVLFVAAAFHKHKSGYICSSYFEKFTSRSDSCHIHTQNIKLCVQCFATTLLLCSILGLASDSVASFHSFQGEYQIAGNEQLSSTVFLTI